MGGKNGVDEGVVNKDGFRNEGGCIAYGTPVLYKANGYAQQP